MPVHDWARVSAGTFHDFHAGWIAEIRKALNNGILPPQFYAMAEQVAGETGPDVLTLEADTPPEEAPPREGTVTTLAAPQTRFVFTAEIDEYVFKRRTIVIRHSSEDRIVAMIEILSPGNKNSRHALREFLDKSIKALVRGINLLLVDLHPPGRRDPQGIHGAVWGEIADESFSFPADKPLTLASYAAGKPITARVEPVAVGDTLLDMPLYLQPNLHVLVPLEATYAEAWRGMPQRWKRVLEAPRA